MKKLEQMIVAVNAIKERYAIEKEKLNILWSRMNDKE